MSPTIPFAVIFTALWMPVPFWLYLIAPRHLGWNSDAASYWYGSAWVIAGGCAITPVALLWTHI